MDQIKLEGMNMSNKLAKVNDLNGLIRYFAEELRWNIDLSYFDDVDDFTYEFDADDLGLKEEAFAKIASLRQLPPLVENQKWGIFCVDFESKRFESAALKKVLSGLIPKKRNSANHAVWSQQDLLFLCFWGEENNRTVGLAHFKESEQSLSQIKIISCSPGVEDVTQLKVFAERLAKLTWPEDTTNTELWRKQWESAFVTGYRENIDSSSELTKQLAKEAKLIRDRILSIMEVESYNGYVHLLYNKFKDTLVHDMKEKEFADMYAQTVVYGLFSARCMDETQSDFSAEEAIECIPTTNPFLKSLLRECLLGNGNGKLSFDELEIANVIDILLNTKTVEIIKDFNRQTGGGKEDPVIHFYEEFLEAYDKEQRVQRGVYYTPQPVVNFMIRAIDDILKTKFSVEDGLASNEMKVIKEKRTSKRRKNGMYTEVEDELTVPRIQVLDPSTGTGTFLRQLILHIYSSFMEKNKSDIGWNEYVNASLLPRINGFELMMAPYAVAHMKLAMVLKNTGYSFDKEKRLKVYLSNTLEEPGSNDFQLTLFEDPLAIESVQANDVKKNTGINIVLGNPPYAISSANKNKWIEELLAIYKTEPGGKSKLQEQKHSIDSDEFKFIRYGQHIIDTSGTGILAYINPHGYLDKPTFRGMRWQLLSDFDEIYIINLHGNSNHQEVDPNGGKDENVFDIQQGVCINIFVKQNNKKKGLAKVFYKDVYGSRESKYELLNKFSLDELDFEEVIPKEPYYMFVPSANENEETYYSGFCLEKLLTKHLEGIQTGKDKLVLSDTKDSLEKKIEKFISLDVESARTEYDLGKDGRDWTVEDAQKDLRQNYPDKGKCFEIGVRPFDTKWSFYTGKSSGFIKCCRDKVSREMIGRDNLAFVLTRNAMPQKPFSNYMIVNKCVVGRFIGDFSTSSQVFPIYSYEEILGKEKKVVNFDDKIIKQINFSLGLELSEKEEIDTSKNYGVDHLIGYIYGILNSDEYKIKYKEFLCRDFPFIPYPISQTSFFEIAELGLQLVQLHCAGIPTAEHRVAFETGDNEVSKIQRKGDNVYINKTQAFMNVSEAVWNYWLGGHQIVQKWIKERKGAILSQSDILQYCNIISVIEETMELTNKIDNVVKHGI